MSFRDTQGSEQVFLEQLKQIILTYVKPQSVTVYLLGSRAHGTARPTSDVDIGLLPNQPLPPNFLTGLREIVEESTIPYSVDIIDLSQLTEESRQQFLRRSIIWKD